jgi:hypothetical protein
MDNRYGRILRRLMEQSGNEASEAIRILEWVACSFRVLKSHEVQDGILFHTRDIELNEQTKLKGSVLKLCKPLIELGPKNTIDFVHYSAKE